MGLEEVVLGYTKNMSEFEERSLQPDLKRHNLKVLRLTYLDKDDNIFRHDLWPKFPWLRELVVSDCNSDYDWNDIGICNPSLEIVTLCIYDSILIPMEYFIFQIYEGLW